MLTKFLHCADVHLDASFSSLGLDFNKAFVRRQDLKDVFGKIIAIAKEENVDFIIISGDLYEHDYVRASTIAFMNESFKEISDIKVFIVPGNHDPYVVNSYYKNFSWNDNVHILLDSFFSLLIPGTEAEGERTSVRIYGIGFKSFSQHENILSRLDTMDERHINILALHGTVDINIQDKYNPVTSAELASINADYVALGHFHKRQDNIGGIDYINNPGSPEPLGFDEPGDHGVYIVEVKKESHGVSEVSKKFISTNNKAYHNFEINIGNCCSNQEIIEKVLGKFTHTDNGNLLISVVLNGVNYNNFNLDPEFIYQCLKNEFFFVKIQNNTKPGYDIEEIAREMGLRGLFVKKMLERLEKCRDDIEKDIVEKAMYYGLEALESKTPLLPMWNDENSVLYKRGEQK